MPRARNQLLNTRPTALLALSVWILAASHALALPTLDPTTPANQTNRIGSDVTFCVVATGTPPVSYQWRSYQTGVVFTNIPGATNECLVLTNVQPTTDRFRLVVCDPSGCATSRLAVLAVLVPPIFTNQPTDQVVGLGENYTNRVVVGGDAPLSYQWFFVAGGTTNLLAGKTANPLILSNVQFTNSGGYFVVVTNRVGTNISDLASLQVVTFPPAILVQPANATVEPGQTYTNGLVAAGTASLSCQWHFNGRPLAGKTNSTISIPNIQPANAGGYSVLVTNPYGAVTSRVATLSLATTVLTRITDAANAPFVKDPGAYWGSAWVDYDKDGDVDLFVCKGGPYSLNEYNRLYRNDGGGHFTRMTTNEAGPIVGQLGGWFGCTWGDYDNDGFLDVSVMQLTPGDMVTNFLYRNTGQGSFTRVLDTGPLKTDYLPAQSLSWVDFDNDGWLDLFFASAWRAGGTRMALYRNMGNGTFGRVPSAMQDTDALATEVAAWGDSDGDGDLDLVVTRGGGSPAFFYRNEGSGQFCQLTNAITLDTGSALIPAWADYDNDGRLDLFLGYFSSTSRLFHNEGNGQFTRMEIGAAGQNANGAWGDYDNDGDLDLLLAGGQSYDVRQQFFANNGDGTFSELRSFAPAAFSGRTSDPIWGDYDNDGFLDLFLPHMNTMDNSRLYHNEGNTNHWLMVTLDGTVANRTAIGAKVRVLATIFGKTYWQMREISGGNRSQNDLRAHFGLGDSSNAMTLRIEWPSGHITEVPNVAANQILTIQEPPGLDCVAMGGGALQLRVVGKIGERYDISTSSDIAAPATKWVLWQTVTNTSRTMTVTDPSPDAPQRFYKAMPTP